MKDLGALMKLSIHIDQPMKMNFDMEFQKLCLLVGMNGSGKSMMLKLHWALETTIVSVIQARKAGQPIETKEVAQYVMDNTFSDQNFNGSIIAYFINGTLEIALDKGKVVHAGHNIDSEVKDAGVPIFMSANLRKFSEIDKYLKMEKLVGIEKMTELYRLYDVVFVQQLKAKLTNGYKTPKSFKDSMLKFDGMEKHEFESFFIEDDSVKFVDKSGNKKSISSLSDGEQSLVNMVLANC